MNALRGIGVLAVLLAAPVAAVAQAYPAKPVRVVIVFPAGGSNDVTGRIVFARMPQVLGQQFVLENRGGSGGVIGSELVAKSPPDGYTLMVQSTTHVANAHLYRKLPYDVLKDFIGVTTLARQVGVLVVHPSMPVKSVKELVALAKARPGVLNYASAATGTTNHLAAELLKYMTRTNIVRVGFKGHASAFNALLGGETHLMFAIVGPAMAQAKAGRARALAVTSAAPTPLAPELPTMAASGLPGFEVVFVAGIFAPAGTPAAIVTRLQGEIARVLERPESKDRLRNVAMETVGSSPDELAATIKAEYNVMAKVVKEAGIRDE